MPPLRKRWDWQEEAVEKCILSERLCPTYERVKETLKGNKIKNCSSCSKHSKYVQIFFFVVIINTEISG